MNTKTQADEIKHVFHIEDDGSITPRTLTRGSAVPEIPPGVFSLIFEPPTPIGPAKIYLRPESQFKLPKKLYGEKDIQAKVDRFLKSYEINDKNLGVMLVGEKGSGKTMMLKALAVKAVSMGFPVILINEQIPSEVLNWFMGTITQSTLVCFDEYEKTYAPEGENDNKDNQRAILQLLDGTNTGSKKMFCLTVNQLGAVSEYLVDRPSRIRYVLQYDRLAPETVVDYVQANLKDCTEDHVRAFLHVALADAHQSNGMNFDTMAEFVKEMTQFGGDLDATLKLMGGRNGATNTYFDVTAFENGVKLFQGYATGEHRGAYLARAETEILLSYRIQNDEESALQGYPSNGTTYAQVTLTREHFVGFGDAHDMLLFAKDGIDYHLRYIDHESSGKVQSALQRAKPGKRLGARSSMASPD